MKKEVELKEAYEKSIQILKSCSTPFGFRAAQISEGPYSRIWGRDSMICSIAALTTNDKSLIKQVKKSLKTLLKFQHKQGQIPSNVDMKTKRVSYGWSAGRIDALLWFLIGFSQYVKRTHDRRFLKKHYEAYKKAFRLAQVYEFNNRGFIYVPKGGDWADEFIQEGYVLYDELLYYRAFEEFISLRKKIYKKNDFYEKKKSEIRKKILTNFLPNKSKKNSESVYNKILFEKTLQKKKYHTPYLLPFFSPSSYGFRFDGFANTLAILFGILDKKNEKKLLKYVFNNFGKKTNYLLPAFSPPITKKDPEWQHLIENYSIKFKNKPHEYHNGGLWPVVTGFFAAAISKKNPKEARNYLLGINKANSQNGKSSWDFYEYLNSKNFKAKGTKKQAWSAAAGIIAYNSVIKKEACFI
ncbi:MAG: glycoside hydrolase 100 family protein [Candidatus Pacearchaeota archaeon]|jgi:hypothetical protein